MSDDAERSVNADALYVDLERILLKPLTEAHVKYTFRGRKSLALLHSWDEIVYKNIRRVFKYKEFEKEWQHIVHDERHLMQSASDYKRRRALRAQSRSSKGSRSSRAPKAKSSRARGSRTSSSSSSSSSSSAAAVASSSTSVLSGRPSSGHSTKRHGSSRSAAGSIAAAVPDAVRSEKVRSRPRPTRTTTMPSLQTVVERGTAAAAQTPYAVGYAPPYCGYGRPKMGGHTVYFPQRQRQREGVEVINGCYYYHPVAAKLTASPLPIKVPDPVVEEVMVEEHSQHSDSSRGSRGSHSRDRISSLGSNSTSLSSVTAD